MKLPDVSDAGKGPDLDALMMSQVWMEPARAQGGLRSVLESWSTTDIRKLARRLYLPEADALERHHLIPSLMRLYAGRF